MNLIKVTILFRDIEFIYKFQKKAGESFWDSFQEKLSESVASFSVEKRGGMQSNYYFCAEDSAETVSESLSQLIKSLISGDTEDYIISIKEVSDEEAKKLTRENIGSINQQQWFIDYLRDNDITVDDAQTQLTEAAGKATDNAPLDELRNEPVKAAPEAQPEPPKEPEQTRQLLTLQSEIEKLLTQKEQLLSRVKGQRHAVEEVLSTVFECDAFTSRNEKRSGPLASFLFTGPSGVGKTYLAKQCGELLGRKCKIIDMSEYSDNLAHGKFNGDYNHRPEVTSFIRENPDGILVFDEMEKAHINTIHQFLQILDEGHLTDVKLNKKISFKDSIIIITTNAGRSLYEDTSVCDLSNVPRRVILEALRKDVNDQTGQPYFPDCIVTRFANGHVVLFNHLEPYALTEIIREEIALQTELFNKSYGISVNYDPAMLSALVLFVGGGVSDARTLRGIARQMIVKELQESVIQTYKQLGDKVNELKSIELSVDIDLNDREVSDLFINRSETVAAVFCNADTAQRLSSADIDNVRIIACTDADSFKKTVRGVVDFAVIDPIAGLKPMEYTPTDIEDVRSDGMEMFAYCSEHLSELPVYALNTASRDAREFDTLLAEGVRGIIALDTDESFEAAIKEVSFHSHINNAVFSLGRAGKVLTYNSYQYNVDDETSAVMFSRLKLGFAKSTDDTDVLTSHDRDNGVTFDDIIGCKAAKDALKEFCGFVSDPREFISKGRRIPKGVLLYGPPGTGKTMLAKAMANEANVAFLPMSATSFFGPYVGQSERNIRELFRRARKYAPSIIFIDEVDAFARRRTGSDTTSHYENALNAFIAEMEGFTTDEKRPVFIMAATNYDVSGSGGRVLDEAFVRRFDKKIFVDLPDKDARYEFFEKKLRYHGIDFGDIHESVLQNMAKRTSGSSNADLEKIVEMFISAVGDTQPSPAVLMDMIDAFRFGEVNKTSPDRLRQTACHESGHAMVNRLLGNTPLFLTVVSRGGFGGYMEHQHDEDALYYSYKQLMNLVCCSLAGRVAEIEVYGKDDGLNTGASSDIEHARRYIRAALDDYAMGDQMFSKSEDEVGEKIMKEQYERTVALVREHRSSLEKLTDLLVQHKSLDQQQLEDFFESEGI